MHGIVRLCSVLASMLHVVPTARNHCASPSTESSGNSQGPPLWKFHSGWASVYDRKTEAACQPPGQAAPMALCLTT